MKAAWMARAAGTFALLLALLPPAAAEPGPAGPDLAGPNLAGPHLARPNLAGQIQDIKQQTIELNRDLFILEEELLFPGNTQIAVYLSLDVGTFFALDAVKLSIDGDVVAHYLYTERQVDALQRGGIHRLYLGNIRSGSHEVVAVFTGRGPKGRDYRRATQLTLEKTTGAKNLELQIRDVESSHQPEFAVMEW